MNGDNVKSHFSGNEQKLQKRTPEEVHLQTASENRQRWCGCDMYIIFCVSGMKAWRGFTKAWFQVFWESHQRVA